MSTFICIDPGPKRSAVAVMDVNNRQLWDSFYCANTEIIDYLRGCCSKPDLQWAVMLVEAVSNYGAVTGKTVNEMLLWSGRFIESYAGEYQLIYKPEASLALTGHRRAKDKHINGAIYDWFPANGGGANPAKGTKSNPGPLYGINNQHLRDAIALGIAFTQGAKSFTLENGADV